MEELNSLIYKDSIKRNRELSKNDISVMEFRSRAEIAGYTQEEVESWIKDNELALEGKELYIPFATVLSSVVTNHKL